MNDKKKNEIMQQMEKDVKEISSEKFSEWCPDLSIYGLLEFVTKSLDSFTNEEIEVLPLLSEETRKSWFTTHLLNTLNTVVSDVRIKHSIKPIELSCDILNILRDIFSEAFPTPKSCWVPKEPEVLLEEKKDPPKTLFRLVMDTFGVSPLNMGLRAVVGSNNSLSTCLYGLRLTNDFFMTPVKRYSVGYTENSKDKVILVEADHPWGYTLGEWYTEFCKFLTIRYHSRCRVQDSFFRIELLSVWPSNYTEITHNEDN